MSFTYFIQAQCGGPIKIGFAKDPQYRLAQLQTGNPEPLVIIALIPGNVESYLHQLFEHFRISGEWFHPNEELLQYARQHADGVSTLHTASVEELAKLLILHFERHRDEINQRWMDLGRHTTEIARLTAKGLRGFPWEPAYEIEETISALKRVLAS